MADNLVDTKVAWKASWKVVQLDSYWVVSTVEMRGTSSVEYLVDGLALSWVGKMVEQMVDW